MCDHIVDCGTNTGGRALAFEAEVVVDEVADDEDDDDDDRLVGVGKRKSNSDGTFLVSLSLVITYALVSGGSSSGCG